MLLGSSLAEKPKETPIRASAASKRGISRTTFSFRRVFPYESTSPLPVTVVTGFPWFCISATERRASSGLGRPVRQRPTHRPCSSSAAPSVGRPVLYVAFIFDVSEHFWKYCSFGALERGRPSLRNAHELSCRSKPSAQQESHGHSAGSGHVCHHSCLKRDSVQQDSQGAWTSETRGQEWRLAIGGSWYDGDALRERPRPQ